jgi:hypothetical protein
MTPFGRSYWRKPLVRAARFGIAALSSVGAALSFGGAALASQGPGGAHGTASPAAQLAMAVAVYGCAALVIGAGLIIAIRRRRQGVMKSWRT